VGQQELFTLAVAIAGVMIVGRAVARRFEVPDAIVLVVLGVLVGVIPRVPQVDLPPDIVLLLFLPPLIYNAAFLSAPRESRENAIPITGLAFGATAATILSVGWVTRLVLPGLSWAPALAFASAVAPTDAVAATSVLTRLGAPQRVVTILEGESLINDAVALTAFGLAVEAMAHPFTLAHGVLRLAEVVLGGIAYGLVVAVVIGRIRQHIHDPASQILVSLITPFVAYVPAEELHVSGVLATVVAGVYLGTRTDGLIQPASRVTGTMFWRMLIFLLESALFVLLGLELRSIVDHLPGAHSVPLLAGASAAVVATVVLVRLAWELLVSPLARFLPGPHPAFVRNPWGQRLVIGWGGMRGAISLAIALTIPTMLNGRPFGERPTLVFLAAIVVMATLIGQGLTLAPLLRVLGLAQSERHQRAEASARMKVTEAGLARLDQLAEAGEVDQDTANVFRQLLEMRLDRVRVALGHAHEDDVADTAGLSRALVRAERDKLAEMYRDGEISDEIRRSISRTLDLQEPRPFG
jgi:CPA1 family monovalent cation:H+ antiporter